jgi:hypothetical protein
MMDGWGRGKWENGQILIYQNKKKNGRERKQQVSNPSKAMGDGSRCSK